MKRPLSPEPPTRTKRVKLQQDMAVGVMSRYKRRARARRWQVKGKGVPKAVKAYVNRAVKADDETKVVLGALDDFRSLGAVTTYVWTPSWQISQGGASNQRVGRKITDVRVRINVSYTHRGEDALFTQFFETSWVRMLVLRTRHTKTAGVTSASLQVNPLGMGVGNIFRFTANRNNVFADVETRSWTVIKDVKWRAGQQSESTLIAGITHRSFNIPVGKNLTYVSGDGFGYFTGSETYIVFVCGAMGSIAAATDSSLSSVSNVGTLGVTGVIMFKDA